MLISFSDTATHTSDIKVRTPAETRMTVPCSPSLPLLSF